MGFQLCLFDLDDTLVRTSDLEKIRLAGKKHDSEEYRSNLKSAFATYPERNIYSDEHISALRKIFPEMRIGVFTRSPRSYAETILSLAFPKTSWDIIVSYEDVRHTKPHGEGIDKAMGSFGYKYLSQVVLVGDGDSDIRAAYNAGCVVFLDRTSWNERKKSYDNWNALGHIPDVMISSPDELAEALAKHERMLPDLERRLVTEKNALPKLRFDKINKFIPKSVGGDNTPYAIFAGGRIFANYKSLDWRRKWHALTESIYEHKSADEFPQEWIDTIKAFIRSHFATFMFKKKILVTAIPHRPGRAPRLEKFLEQVEASIASSGGVGKAEVAFDTGLLAYKGGVKSNSGDKLSSDERFQNVENHLYVARPEVAKEAQNVLILDDVCTSGSSLIYAKKRIEECGAGNVTCLALAMTVSDVL